MAAYNVAQKQRDFFCGEIKYGIFTTNTNQIFHCAGFPYKYVPDLHIYW